MISIRTDDYGQAVSLSATLAAAQIQSSITEGGVTIVATPDRIPEAQAIAQNFGLNLKAGNAIEIGGGWEECFSVKGQALLEEWIVEGDRS